MTAELGRQPWLIYGLMIDSLPIILANAVTFVLAGANVILKLRYG